MSEQVIICTAFSRFYELVDVIRWTDKRLYYRPLPHKYDQYTRRETFCNLSNVAVRNANPEMFAELREREEAYRMAKVQMARKMSADFNDACDEFIKVSGGIVQGKGMLS